MNTHAQQNKLQLRPQDMHAVAYSLDKETGSNHRIEFAMLTQLQRGQFKN